MLLSGIRRLSLSLSALHDIVRLLTTAVLIPRRLSSESIISAYGIVSPGVSPFQNIISAVSEFTDNLIERSSDKKRAVPVSYTHLLII